MSAGQKRILIAEDDASIVVSLEFLMREAGYEVCSVSDGAAALREVATFRPDLILLDVMLPLRDGFQVCRELRAAPGMAALKIVMLTAKGGQAEVEKGISMGADLYVTKPFATRDLLASVKTLLDG